MYDDTRWRTRRWIGLGFLVVFAIFVGTMIYYMFYVLGNQPPATYYPFFPFGFGFFGFFLVIFLIFGLMRWIFWWPGRWAYRRHGYYARGAEAYQILRERYARGEITKEQFEQMSRDLEQH